MNETENTRLLRLYKLLWEQIKDEGFVYELSIEISTMYDIDLISWDEETLLIDNVFKNKIYPETADRKAFVQRMIKELENQN